MVKRIAHIIWLALLGVLLLSCEVRNWNNPYDAGNFLGVESPKNLEILQVNVHTALLTWESEQSHVAGYKIDRKIGEDGDWIPAYGATDSTAWVDTAVVTKGINYYRVYAFADENESLPLVSSINPSFPKPAEFELIQITDTDIRLSWHDQSNGEEGFRIDRKIDENSWDTEYALVGQNTQTWTDTSIFLDTTMTYRVYAYAGENLSGEETKDIKPTFANPEDFQVEVLDDHRLKLYWNDIYDFETGFRIYRKVDAGSFNFLADVSANSVSFTDSNLTVGERYVYRIQAFTPENLSHAAVSSSKQTYLPPPQDMTLSSNDPDSVYLAWNTTDLSYVTGYQVERKETGGTYEIRGITDVPEFHDSDLNPDRKYSYFVRTVTAHNVSEPSNVHSIIWGEYYQEKWRGNHSNNVLAVALSPDTQWVASGGQDNAVRLWNRSSGALEWTGNHTGPVNTVEFDNASQTLVSAGYDFRVISWDVASGTQNWSGQHNGVVYTLAIAPDNTQIATGGQDNMLIMWDATTGDTLWTATHSNDVFGVAFSADGSAVASVDGGGTATLWDADTGAEVWSMDVGAALNTVKISTNSDAVFIAGSRGLTVLDYNTGNIVWENTIGSVRQLALTSDGVTILAMGPDIPFMAWTTQTGNLIWQSPTSVSFSALTAAGNTARGITGDEEGNVTVWNAETGSQLWSGSHNAKIWTVDSAENASWIVSGGYDNQVRCWNQIFKWITPP